MDFYCSALGLVIEIDGSSHANQIEYDYERTRILNAYGLQVIRYTNKQVLSQLPELRLHLLELIQSRQTRPGGLC